MSNFGDQKKWITVSSLWGEGLSNEHINFSICLCPGLCGLRWAGQPAKIASCLALSRFLLLRGECCILSGVWRYRNLSWFLEAVNSPALGLGQEHSVVVIFFPTNFNDFREPQTSARNCFIPEYSNAIWEVRCSLNSSEMTVGSWGNWHQAHIPYPESMPLSLGM